jgi:hypothetical protein
VLQFNAFWIAMIHFLNVMFDCLEVMRFCSDYFWVLRFGFGIFHFWFPTTLIKMSLLLVIWHFFSLFAKYFLICFDLFIFHRFYFNLLATWYFDTYPYPGTSTSTFGTLFFDIFAILDYFKECQEKLRKSLKKYMVDRINLSKSRYFIK